MTAALPGPLVSTAWLAETLGAADLKVVDGSFVMPDSGRSIYAEFEQGHIPGAKLFDIDAIKDPLSPLPHMVPEAYAFADAVAELSIGSGDRVVVYDSNNIAMAAARVWWMFRLFGHDNVAVLNGGLPKWRRESRPLETGAACAPKDVFDFAAKPQQARLAGENAVDQARRSGNALIVDARDPARFSGAEPEVRQGIRSGHIPGSVNLPWTSLVDPANGTLLSPEGLRERLDAAGVDFSKPVISSCGSGVTACVLALAAEVLGAPAVSVYDGSWTEWGREGGPPIETA